MDAILDACQAINIRRHRDCTLADNIFGVHPFIGEVCALFSPYTGVPWERITNDTIFFFLSIFGGGDKGDILRTW
jgi:hypothetical protein